MEHVEKDPARILVVEDDVTISDLLSYYLRRQGYDVVQEYNGRTGTHTALSSPLDLVLMDLLLPDLDGMSAAKEILRRRPDMPVIILSAVSDKDRLLEGFQNGITDYIAKPFDVDVLMARIAAALRRTREVSFAERSALHLVTENVGFELDPETRSLCAHGLHVPLTPKEHDLLELLASRPGHLFPKEEITESVWRHRYVSTSRTLDLHVRRLRGKLNRVGARVEIRGVRGVGYRFVTPPD